MSNIFWRFYVDVVTYPYPQFWFATSFITSFGNKLCYSIAFILYDMYQYMECNGYWTMVVDGIFVNIWCRSISYGGCSLGFCNNGKYAGFVCFLYLAFHSLDAPQDLEWCFHLCIFYKVTPCPLGPLCPIYTLPAHIVRNISCQIAKRYERNFIWCGLTLQ